MEKITVAYGKENISLNTESGNLVLTLEQVNFIVASLLRYLSVESIELKN